MTALRSELRQAVRSLRRGDSSTAAAFSRIGKTPIPIPPSVTYTQTPAALALTGPLSATAQIHKLVGDIYVEQANAQGGWLGRKLEWVVKDDQSKPDLARTLYEQLVTADKVDLLMGPYATGAILSAMGVAQRYNKVLIHHTLGIPALAKYDMQFPAWSLGPDPGVTLPGTVFDALAASPKPPKTVAVVTSKFPSIHFMSLGAREVLKKRGLQEVLFLEWDFGNRDLPCVRVRAWLQMQCTACALYTARGLSGRWLHRPILGALLRRRGIALHYVSAAYWRKGQ